MLEKDKTSLIRDLEHRIKCVRKAGGSVQDDSVTDGNYDIRSLRVMCDVAGNRVVELWPLELEFIEKSKTSSIYKDEIALLLREERRTLCALIDEAEKTIEVRIKELNAQKV